MRRSGRSLLIGLCGATALAATVVVILVRDGRGERPRTGVPVFGSSESKIIGREAVLAPPPANPKQDLRLTVTVAVTYDAPTQLYTYAYTVENQNNSGNALETWGVAPVRDPVAMAAPAHWGADNRWEERLDSVVWSVVDDVGSPDTTLQSLSLHLSPYSPPPGTTLSGFSFTSRQPPATVTFYAQGADTLYDVAEDAGEVIPSNNTLFTNGVSGTTLGPDITSVVSVGDRPSGPKGMVEFRLPAPNPSSGDVSIAYYLPSTAKVQVAIHDLSGRRIRLLADGERPGGLHAISWDGTDDRGQRAGSGVYFTRLIVDGKRIGEQKVTILR
jgi:flagellar hook capping protein FlgD